MEPRKHLDIHFSIPLWRPSVLVNWRTWLPSRGNVIFTTLVIAVLVLTQNVWARAIGAPAAGVGASATTINYQGRLADLGGSPITQNNVPVTFTIYDAAQAGNPLWTEARVVNVANGLFNVGLGDQTPGGIPTSIWNGDRYLEIMVGSETLTPRELIRSVPVAGMALTVPNGAIGSSQIADGSVTQSKLAADAKTLILDTGYFYAGTNTQGWGLHLGTGDRQFRTHVTFTKVFAAVPAIALGLQRFDLDNTKGIRLNVYPDNVSKTGFDIVFEAWADTVVNSASVYWTATGY